ncbi:MAG: hypothetical protein AAB427_09600 [Chloroflexota bacterium]
MKILVLLKQILDPRGVLVNRKAGKVFVNREDYMINPADTRALEAALKIKDATGAEVIAATAGPTRAEAALREARAVGVDRAILINDDRRDVPVECLYKALCETIGGIDLICAGDSALDSGVAIGPALAEALGVAFLANALECSVEGNVVRIVRKDGAVQRLHSAYEADLPAVVTFTRDAPALRYPHGGAIIDSYRQPDAIETWSLVDLGLSETDAQPVIVERGQSFPPEREFGKETTIEEMAKIMNNEQ